MKTNNSLLSWHFVNESENCLYLSVTTYAEICFYFMQKHTFQHYYIKCILFCFFQDHFLVQSSACLDNILMYVDNV